MLGWLHIFYVSELKAKDISEIYKGGWQKDAGKAEKMELIYLLFNKPNEPDIIKNAQN